MSAEFAGSLSEQILIEAPSTERDPTGLQQPTWVKVCNCRASIRVESIGPQSQAEALSAMPRYRLTVRRRDGLALGQRISWGDRKMIVMQLFDDPIVKDRIRLRCDEVRG